jgi:N utilization substance protein A
VQELKDSARMPQIIVSQADVAMVREVFELEVPEIEDGLVEIKAIAREAGHRTKVAVHSPDPEVDPQGACIGTRGSRIQAIVAELKNEKIDIIRWSDNTAEFIANALAPSRIFEVRLHPNPELRKALIIVPDDQLSLAIGKEGQNVRLAAKLTGFKLDIKSYTQFMTLRDEVFRQQRIMQEQAQNNPADDTGNADVAMAFLGEPVDNGLDGQSPA